MQRKTESSYEYRNILKLFVKKNKSALNTIMFKIKRFLRLCGHFVVSIKHFFCSEFYKFRIRNKTKIFCIGLNKTGTTSLKIALEEFGITIGSQTEGQLLFDDWKNMDFKKLFALCRTAQGFQDVPFSLPETYKYLDKQFPGSKFILTVRDSDEQWYNSITRFHSKLWSDGKRIPIKNDLQNACYISKGKAWELSQVLFNTPEDEPYKKENLLKYYNDHNSEVLDYFEGRENNFLIINPSAEDAYEKLCKFINVKQTRAGFPWENKT